MKHTPWKKPLAWKSHLYARKITPFKMRSEKHPEMRPTSNIYKMIPSIYESSTMEKVLNMEEQS